MSFQVIVTKGTPLTVRKEPCDRPVQEFRLEHQKAALRAFTSSNFEDGEEWGSLPMEERYADELINHINEEQNTRGGKRSKRKRPTRKSRKLKYFSLKRK